MAKEICLKKGKKQFSHSLFHRFIFIFLYRKGIQLLLLHFCYKQSFCKKRLKSRKKRLKTLINQHLTGNPLTISTLETSKKLKKFKKKRQNTFFYYRFIVI